MTKYARKCTKCGVGMNEGYCFDGGQKYYCSDACLHKDFTPAQWEKAYNNGEGDSYYTEWEMEDFQYKLVKGKIVDIYTYNKLERRKNK